MQALGARPWNMADRELTNIEKLEALTVADRIDQAMTPYRANALGLYAGISKDAPQRLSQHKVEDHFTYERCSCEAVAREAEKILLQRGYKGDVGGGTGKGDCIYVYAYVIRTTTKEAKRPFPSYSR